MRSDWYDIEEQAAGSPPDDGLGVLRGIRSAALLIGALIGIAVALFLAVNAIGHDSSGRVRSAVEGTK